MEQFKACLLCFGLTTSEAEECSRMFQAMVSNLSFGGSGSFTCELVTSCLALISIFESCSNESLKQGVGRGRLTLEFGVELNRDEEKMIGDFHDFAKISIR